jgi:hypothetical protein
LYPSETAWLDLLVTTGARFHGVSLHLVQSQFGGKNRWCSLVDNRVALRLLSRKF